MQMFNLFVEYQSASASTIANAYLIMMTSHLHIYAYIILNEVDESTIVTKYRLLRILLHKRHHQTLQSFLYFYSEITPKFHARTVLFRYLETIEEEEKTKLL